MNECKKKVSKQNNFTQPLKSSFSIYLDNPSIAFTTKFHRALQSSKKVILPVLRSKFTRPENQVVWLTKSKVKEYDGLSGTLKFHSGETSKQICLNLIETPRDESEEVIDVVLTHVKGDDYPLLEEGLRSLVLSIGEVTNHFWTDFFFNFWPKIDIFALTHSDRYYV